MQSMICNVVRGLFSTTHFSVGSEDWECTDELKPAEVSSMGWGETDEFESGSLIKSPKLSLLRKKRVSRNVLFKS